MIGKRPLSMKESMRDDENIGQICLARGRGLVEGGHRFTRLVRPQAMKAELGHLQPKKGG